jgi:hypothetical protein
LWLFGLQTASLAGTESKEGEKVVIGTIAGSYYFGDGLGIRCSLVVEPEGRFSFRWEGCLGVYGKNEGGAKLVNNHLILTPEQPNDSSGFGGAPTDFVPVGCRYDPETVRLCV